MDTRHAIILFSQSEKIKAGLIWAAQTIEALGCGHADQRKGTDQQLRLLIAMIGHEVMLARRITADDEWREVEKSIDMALVMIDSGVAAEAGYHVSRALSRVTTIGRRAMSALKTRGLL
jgi:hypothetical protein